MEVLLYLYLAIVPLFQTQDDSLSKKFGEWLSGATYSVDLCFYELEVPHVKESLIALHNRGIKIRVIVDDDNYYKVHDLVENGIPVLTDTAGGNPDYLMHDKFAIRDARDDDTLNDEVFTGSWNISNQLHADNALIFHSYSLAQAFRKEFEQMWGDTGDYPNPLASRFHTRKVDNIGNHTFIVDGDTVKLYFGPQVRLIEHIVVPEIASADFSVDFLIFAFTRQDLADSLFHLFTRGVMIRGVFDSQQAGSPYSKYNYLRNLGLDVYLDALPPYFYFLHHKFAVVDYSKVVAGSANWSTMANQRNDETVLIIKSPEVAAQFEAEFERRLMEVLTPTGVSLRQDDTRDGLIPNILTHGVYLVPEFEGVFTLNGRKILSKGEVINTNLLPSGVYIVKFKKKAPLKFIKIR